MNDEAQRQARQQAIYDAQMQSLQSAGKSNPQSDLNKTLNTTLSSPEPMLDKNAKEANDTLNDTLRSQVLHGPEKSFDTLYDGWQQIEDSKRRQRIALNEADPKLRRAEDARKWIVGVGEALASVANLGAVANNASNQTYRFMTPEVDKAIEKDRLRRKADIQKLNDEIDNIQAQKMRLRASMYSQEAKERMNAENNATRLKIAEGKNELGKMKEERLAKDSEEKRAAMWARIEATKKRNDELTAMGRERIAISKDRMALAEKKWEAKSKNGGSGSVEFAYSNMLNEIARDFDFTNWKELEESAKMGDQYARQMVNMFSIPKDKANIGKMKAMISEYAEDYAPEFYEEYFNIQPEEPGKVDIFGIGKQSKKVKVF